MKKLFLLIILTTAVTAVAVGKEKINSDQMQFATTLSAPISAFEKVETTKSAKVATAVVGQLPAVATQGNNVTNLNVNGTGTKGTVKINRLLLPKNSVVKNNTQRPVLTWTTGYIELKAGSINGKLLKQPAVTQDKFVVSKPGADIRTISVRHTVSLTNSLTTKNASVRNNLQFGSSIYEGGSSGTGSWNTVKTGETGSETTTYVLVR